MKEFFDRSKDYWLKVAYELALEQQQVDTDTKSLIRMGFPLAEQRFKEMRPLLEEFEEFEKENNKQQQIRDEKNKKTKTKRN